MKTKIHFIYIKLIRPLIMTVMAIISIGILLNIFIDSSTAE